MAAMSDQIIKTKNLSKRRGSVYMERRGSVNMERRRSSGGSQIEGVVSSIMEAESSGLGLSADMANINVGKGELNEGKKERARFGQLI